MARQVEAGGLERLDTGAPEGIW
ncbi:MAG: hypothetical protein RLZZ253_1258, partial [Verrucomicrobiota bacterium]